jgi:hypothetical protein
MSFQVVILIILMVILSYNLYSIYKKYISSAMIIKAKKIALELMLIAERTLATEEGAVRMKFVLDNFYNALPATIKYIIKENEVITFLQKVYDDAKKFISK